MNMFEKIHGWIRRHVTVCGMTLDKIDEEKARVKREMRYKELLVKRENIAILCYSLFCAHPHLYRNEFNAAYLAANAFMEELHGEEWREVIKWRKERGKE